MTYFTVWAGPFMGIRVLRGSQRRRVLSQLHWYADTRLRFVQRLQFPSPGSLPQADCEEDKVGFCLCCQTLCSVTYTNSTAESISEACYSTGLYSGSNLNLVTRWNLSFSLFYKAAVLHLCWAVSSVLNRTKVLRGSLGHVRDDFDENTNCFSHLWSSLLWPFWFLTGGFEGSWAPGWELLIWRSHRRICIVTISLEES